ncbi:FKBP-type peptidyl-prolyl cis-trans isomerase [Novosphingobium mangrovi (ex Huang et al. 2023)]|uniref:Peptidyl-prolyl cis-trans isomerase n=1 Tax=Novosphingobium mangrovi (ex Huang et al. 2023) TaxID=2976432 RepID=A0ABT2I0A3_9SPHN|nr:FKBP-type peptidyl-prolyl cis-trans isomerase [Novosphingobium mangrovi (ex Huang et al. 2023)]MCT2398224.1 FKBP-type peptidyl-prolyl cis-trans isomerase [Novosphingobium mangrovi (ex Huang et al. 2023)]
MQTAKNGDTVLIDFVVRTGDGRVVGNTEKDGPQTVTIGASEIFPQIEAALDGMEVGGVQAVTVAAADAFGPRREEMVIQIPREHLPQETPPQPGMGLSARQQDGSTIDLVITEVGEDTVTADGNHPLAGEDLHFGLTLVEIRPAA